MNQPGTTRQRTVGILVFPDVEVLDFCGPFEVFSVTRLDDHRRRETGSPFRVLLVAEQAGPVRATGGLTVVPDATLTGCPALDILVVPGGWGARQQMRNETLRRWVLERTKQLELLTSVCTGALVLGQAGLLDGRRATTHWTALDLLAETAPRATVVRDEHVVEDGPELLTSAGIAAGIDMALRVVARLHGEPVARATARHMEHPFPEDNRRRV